MINAIDTLTDEIKARIDIIVRSDRWGKDGQFWGIQIDIGITPLFCLNCNRQLEKFYQMNGGRYGYVGGVVCDCGAEIKCVDSDNIVEYLKTSTHLGEKVVGQYYIDYTKVYKLANEHLLQIKDFFGFDIFEEYKNKTVKLEEIVERLIYDYDCEISGEKVYAEEKFVRLPMLINQWFEILDKTKNGK